LTPAKGKDDDRGKPAALMNYKDHHIEVSLHVMGDPKGWNPDIFVSYSEDGKSVLKTLRMDQIFANPTEAEKAGIEFAKKRIDDGKPER
jgi:hypothetical protein